MEVYEGRTVYDLFNALAVCAKKERLEHQELAEQLAYKVLKKQLLTAVQNCGAGRPNLSALGR